MRREIYRYYPLEERRHLVERLLGRGLLTDESGDALEDQPGKCCPVGCQVPETPNLLGPEERPIKLEMKRLRAVDGQ